MSSKKKLKETAICPDCGAKIPVYSDVALGERVDCPDCNAHLEVVETIPIELDWAPESFEYKDGQESEKDEDW